MNKERLEYLTELAEDNNLKGENIIQLDSALVYRLNRRYYNTEASGETDEAIKKEYLLAKQILIRVIENMPTEELKALFEKDELISIEKVEATLTEIKIK